MLILRLIFACVVNATVTVAITNENEEIVQIKNNMIIIGQMQHTVDANKTYYSFRAIPFAEPPLGDLRFRAPVPITGDQMGRIINSTTDSPSCIQLFSNEKGYEDCLYLDVYLPNFVSDFELLPVMVWFYGGGFMFGDASYTSYGPDFLLNENVIVVTVNYRLGIFGFLNTNGSASPGNYGLKDQVLAMKWINENIIYFRGNPNQVTIFGQSAGSASVSYLVQFPVMAGLFQGVIMQSGTSLCGWALQQNGYETALSLAFILNIQANSPETLVDALRQINSETLQLAQLIVFLKDVILNNIINGLPFGPDFEPPSPDALITSGSFGLLKQGNFNKVPFMIGHTSLEALIDSALVDPLRLYIVQNNKLPEDFLPKGLHIYEQGMRNKVNNIIKEYYFGEKPNNISVRQLLVFFSDMLFVRPITKSALLYSNYAPVYFYIFSYEGPLSSGQKKEKGVAHADELPYIWNIQSSGKPTEEDLKIRYRLVRMWTNFAKYRNPTPIADPLLENVFWPTADNEKTFSLKYLNISSNMNISSDPNWNTITFWENLFNEYGNPPYSTY